MGKEKRRGGQNHMESNKTDWIYATTTQRETPEWCWGYLLLTLSWLHNAPTVYKNYFSGNSTSSPITNVFVPHTFCLSVAKIVWHILTGKKLQQSC